MLFCDPRSVDLWLNDSVGKQLLAEQQALLDECLETLFGYHLLQLSFCDHRVLYQASKIKHRFRLCEKAGQGICASEFESLPLLTDSVDVVILHHVLDYSENPHALLREAARVLMPGGHIIILGFNPFGPLALFNRSQRFLPNARFSASRLADWLNLLEFSEPDTRYGFYRLPFTKFCQSQESPWYFRFPEKKQWPIGGFYGLLARKQPAAIMPIKPKRHKAALGMAVKPSICKDLSKKTFHDSKR